MTRGHHRHCDSSLTFHCAVADLNNPGQVAEAPSEDEEMADNDGEEGSGNEGDSADARGGRAVGRAGEAETLFQDLGPMRDQLSRTPGYRGPVRLSKLHFVKLKLYEEYCMSVHLHNKLSPGVTHAAGTMDCHHALGLPILELGKIKDYVDSRIKVLVHAHRVGLGCPTCSKYDHAAMKATNNRRGLNRSATHWYSSPDFWPQTPF